MQPQHRRPHALARSRAVPVAAGRGWGCQVQPPGTAAVQGCHQAHDAGRLEQGASLDRPAGRLLQTLLVLGGTVAVTVAWAARKRLAGRAAHAAVTATRLTQEQQVAEAAMVSRGRLSLWHAGSWLGAAAPGQPLSLAVPLAAPPRPAATAPPATAKWLGCAGAAWRLQHHHL